MKESTLETDFTELELESALMSYLDRPKKRGDEIMSLCPFHEENNASFSANIKKRVYNCFACGAKGYLKSLNLSKEFSGTGYTAKKPLPKHIKVKYSRPISDYKIRYEYTDLNGEVKFRKIKAEPTKENPGKDFLFETLQGGRWTRSLETDPFPYNLPETVNADTVYIVEGEKDVETLKSHGVCAVSHWQGAGSAEWTDKESEYLKNKNIVFVPDYDDPGVKYAKRAAGYFTRCSKIKSFSLLNLGFKVEKKHGKDTTDFVTENGIEAFRALKPLSVAEFTAIFGNGILPGTVPENEIPDHEIPGVSEPVPGESTTEPEAAPEADQVPETEISDTTDQVQNVPKKEKKKNNPVYGDFWVIEENKKDVECTLSWVKFIQFLDSFGFGKVYISGKTVAFIRVDNGLVCEVSRANIKDFVNSQINNLSEYELVLSALMKSSRLLYSDQQLEYLHTTEIKQVPKQKDAAHLFYKNCVVKITKNNIETISYNDFGFHVWQNQVIQRDFKNVEWEGFEFAKFCHNVSGGKDDRFKSMMSALGYLLHKYNEPSKMKCIILQDESAKNINDRAGGTGKGITEKAIGYMRNTVMIDDTKLSNKFAYQQVGLDTDIINLPDVSKKFDFNEIYRAVTDGIQVERKGGTEFTIRDGDLPKILISTNHVIRGMEQSDIRRKFEVFYSSFYGPEMTPENEFGHNFFTDWTENDWFQFDSFMVNCVQFYLDFGLVAITDESVIENKLVANTSQEFVDFLNAAFTDDGVRYKQEKVPGEKGDCILVSKRFVLFSGEKYFKDDVIEIFKQVYPGYSWLTSNTFTGWFKYYGKTKGYEYKEHPTNGRRKFSLTRKGE